jgi:hypothetical protein
VIHSARACEKKRRSENEVGSLEEGKRVHGILVCRTLSRSVSLSPISEEVEANCGGKVDCQSVEVDKTAGVCKGTVTQ